MTVTIKSKDTGKIIQTYDNVFEARPSIVSGDLVLDLYDKTGRVIDYPYTIRLWDICIKD